MIGSLNNFSETTRLLGAPFFWESKDSSPSIPTSAVPKAT